MSIRYFYMNPAAEPVELTDRVWTALSWNSSAEELNAVQSEWVIEDPDSDLLLYPWRRVYVLDDDAPEDHTVIGMGFIFDVEIERSEVYLRSPVNRAWRLTITDLNYMPQYPLFDAGDSPDRAIETDLERIAWYLTTAEANHFDTNTDYIDTTGGVSLDALDLTSRNPYEMVRGAMDQSGRNAFVLYDEAVGSPDFETSAGELALFYGKVESDFWTSDIFLSNDPADIDPDNGVFPLAEDDLALRLDPTRIQWKLHVAYDGGMVAVHDDTIGDVYTRREGTVDAPDLTSSVTAAARGNRMLQAGRNPLSRIQWGYHCHADYVNALMAGQTFQYRATHLTNLEAVGAPSFGDEGGVTLRSMDRTVVEQPNGMYYVSGSAVPVAAPASCSVVRSQLAGTFVESADQGADSEPLTGVSVAAGTGDYLAIAVMLGVQSSTSIAGPGSNGNLHAESPWAIATGYKTTADPNIDHTFTGIAYQSNGAGSVEWDWTPGGSVEGWRQGSFLIPTDATAPLQVAAPQLHTGSDAVFPGDVTAGNLLIAVTSAEEAGGPADSTLSGWSLVGVIRVTGGTQTSSAQVFARCVEEGDGEGGDMRTFDLWTGRTGNSYTHWGFCFEVEL